MADRTDAQDLVPAALHHPEGERMGQAPPLRDRSVGVGLAPPVGGEGPPTIVAEGLTKVYRVQKKPPGLMASVRALVHRTYTEVRAVDDVSLTIGRGELVGFLGPNGAGKT